jgi:hypothetical protein
MMIYEVSAQVDESLTKKYELYMKEHHLRDVLASGCFVSATLERASAGKYRTLYRAPTKDDVDRYLREHTALLRADFAKHFPTGVKLEREIWTELVAQEPPMHLSS